MRIKEDSRQNLKYSHSLIILIMKWKHYAISFFMTLIIFVNVAGSQTYSFIYKFTDSIMLSLQEKKPGNESEADTLLMGLLNKIPMMLQGTYTIVSNGKYMIANAAVNSSFSGIRPIGIHFSEPEEIIFDIENRLVYFAEEKKVRKMKMYSLTGVAEIQGTCVKKIVAEKGLGYEVMLCKKIPVIISPPVLFVNSGYGIQSIRAPGLEIELVSYKKEKEDKRLIDCKKFFETSMISAKGYDFFENY